MDRVLIVTPNPAVDVTYRVDALLPGDTVRVRSVERRPGGKGVNVARLLAAAGRDVLAIHPLGGETGAWLDARLTEANVPSHVIPVPGETRTTVTVQPAGAHPTVLAEPGPEVGPEHWGAIESVIARAVAPGDWVVVAGSLPPGTPSPGAVGRLVATASRSGAATLVDTSGVHLAEAAEAGAAWVKGNGTEVLGATGHDDLGSALDRLTAAGCSVLVTLGSHGMLARRPGRPALVQEAVRDVGGAPTGAGDAATAGFLAALLDGKPVEEALRRAAAWGAAAVSSPVAGEIDLELAAALLDRVPEARPAGPLEQREGTS